MTRSCGLLAAVRGERQDRQRLQPRDRHDAGNTRAARSRLRPASPNPSSGHQVAVGRARHAPRRPTPPSSPSPRGPPAWRRASCACPRCRQRPGRGDPARSDQRSDIERSSESVMRDESGCRGSRMVSIAPRFRSLTGSVNGAATQSVRCRAMRGPRPKLPWLRVVTHRPGGTAER